jgi:hypothetical protein
MNIGEYCPVQYSLRVQYDILRGTIFTNVHHAITLLLYSTKYVIPNAFSIEILCILLYLSGTLNYSKYSYLN